MTTLALVLSACCCAAAARSKQEHTLATLAPEVETASNQIVSKKTVWMFWSQGEANLAMRREGKYKGDYQCVLGWRILNPEWEVRVLDNVTARALAPKYQVEADRGIMSLQSLSDLLRLNLLSLYGGVWADISACPVKPIRFLMSKKLSPIGFWTFGLRQANLTYDCSSGYLAHQLDLDSKAPIWDSKAPIHNVDAQCDKDLRHRAFKSRYTVNWFLAASTPHNWIVDKWLDVVAQHFSEVALHEQFPYYIVHCLLAQLRLNDQSLREAVDAINADLTTVTLKGAGEASLPSGMCPPSAGHQKASIPNSKVEVYLYKACTRWNTNYTEALLQGDTMPVCKKAAQTIVGKNLG